MRHHSFLLRGVTACAVLMSLLTGCASSVRISRLVNQPARYQNRMVQVNGEVTNSFGALVAGVYQVDDGTGKIYVLSNGGPPTRGSRVRVKGRVTPGVTFAGRSFGTTIRESDRHVRD